MAYNLQSLITILQHILDPEQTHWTFLTTLCGLLNLEVLKIGDCVFETDREAEEEEWEAEEGDEFGSLQFLHLESLNIVRWRANETVGWLCLKCLALPF